MSSKSNKAYDEGGAWQKFMTLAPVVGKLVDGRAGKGAAHQRGQREKPPLSKDDGRRKRATGRTAVFNTKLKPDFREKLFALADERDIGVAALLEQIVEEWEATKPKRGARS